jgi:hypothetical protein
LQTDCATDVPALLNRVDEATRRDGRHAVGFLSYEAAEAFGLPVIRRGRAVPLAWFALFDSNSMEDSSFEAPPVSRVGYEIGPLTPTRSWDGFETDFGRIRQHLREGNTYQVN